MRGWMALLIAVLGAAAPVFAASGEAGAGAISRRADPRLMSSAVLVVDQAERRALYAKNEDKVMPIASITKLMAAMVVLDANLPLSERIGISEEERALSKGARSRLRIGTALTRSELLQLALMASENRAAEALGRSHPGGARAFVAAMNQKAAALGMSQTHFVDGTGLSSDNVSTARDLAKMVAAAHEYPLIREFTTGTALTVRLVNGKTADYHNSNKLVSSPDWRIGLSKTGYISEAGRCLVMQAVIADKPVIIVLLDAQGKQTRIRDANRLRQWMETRLTAGISG